MRVLLDSCLSGQVAIALRAAKHDVIWAGDWPVDPGDEAILQTAIVESRVVVTIDKDFGELTVARGILHSGLIRLSNFRSSQHSLTLIWLLNSYEGQLTAGAILTAEPWRVRIRLP